MNDSIETAQADGTTRSHFVCPPYQHTVQYYETDKMGIAHHSNYIRWMEEARVYFLHMLGYDFDRLESMGLSSPVLEVHCRYHVPTVFAEQVSIQVSVEAITPVRLKLHYAFTSSDGKLIAEAGSEHTFLDSTGKILRLHKAYPDFFSTLQSCIAPEVQS